MGIIETVAATHAQSDTAHSRTLLCDYFPPLFFGYLVPMIRENRYHSAYTFLGYAENVSVAEMRWWCMCCVLAMSDVIYSFKVYFDRFPFSFISLYLCPVAAFFFYPTLSSVGGGAHLAGAKCFADDSSHKFSMENGEFAGNASVCVLGLCSCLCDSHSLGLNIQHAFTSTTTSNNGDHVING